MVNVRRPRPIRGQGRYPAGYRVYGYWSSVSGNLCMVGSGVSSLSSTNVVLKLHYPNSSIILTSLVSGTLQSLEQVGSVNYFEPISILGVSVMGYNYSLIDKEIENGAFSVYDGMESVSLSLPLGRDLCPLMRLAGKFELVYGNDCNPFSCNFLNRSGEMLPGFMFLRDADCLENGKGRYLLGFSNSTINLYRFPFDPSSTLVAEGAWDVNKKRLDLVACQVVSNNVSLNMGSIGDCSIRLSISLPSTLSLKNRSSFVGKMWTNRSINGSNHFGTVTLRSPGNMNSRIEGVKYQYTEIGSVSKVCQQRLNGNGKKAMYPGGNSADMRFDMIVRNRKGQIASGYTSPFSVGDKFYMRYPIFGRVVGFSSSLNQSVSGVMNISYVMSFTKLADFDLGGEDSAFKSVEISAEGMYNSKTGIACMIGCRHPISEKLQKNESLDCGIIVNIQYASLNGKDGGHVKGTIESTRSKSDPLHFDRLEFTSNSITTYQAKESIWRMDLEITMVLVSNTLACIFVGLQLFYVKKNPDVLPFISVMMLIVLTLAHMIPLLLNFEAMFLANRKQNVFLGSDGWLEVNEVLVRIITMIAFLLQFRLLQLSWSARSGNESQKSLWVSDKKVLYLSLPLYIGGGLIAWFAHLWRSYLKTHPVTSPFMSTPHWGYPQKVSFWGELKSYAGLVLDGFLLPQIAFNLFSDSTEKALAPSFYVGSTIVRLLPHAYDLYRTHTSPWLFNQIYANPRMDYYSTAWDLSISCGGLLCVFLIYLQQRYGGRFFLPKRFRRSNVYEKVPVVSS